MKKQLLLLIALASPLTGTVPSLDLGAKIPNNPSYVSVQNRVLARVQGKAISVRDVTTLLSKSFDQEYPQYAENAEARQQYYLNSWKDMLNELVNRELILSDAEERGIPIPQADVREEMERLFAPNMLATLDQIGLSYEEAWSEIRSDIAMRRMLMVRVNSRAYSEVTPLHVKKAYQELQDNHKKQKEWHYRVISIRSKDNSLATIMASLAYEQLTSGASTLDTLVDDLAPEEVTLTVSQPFNRTQETISQAHQEGLDKLESGTTSQPLAQTTRSGEPLIRLYHLENIYTPQLPSYHEVETEFHDKLVQQAAMREHERYLVELQDKFEVEKLYDLSGSGQDLFLLL